MSCSPCHDLLNMNVPFIWILNKYENEEWQVCMVASNWYLVWMVLWDVIHTPHKYNLGLPKEWL